MNKFNYLGIGKSEYNGFIKKVTDFVVGVQLKDSELWTKIANVFSSSCDDFDEGWRGEFWGKMMRGASLTYAYTKDSELYDVLKKPLKLYFRGKKAMVVSLRTVLKKNLTAGIYGRVNT